jgi:hypothetical protein
LITQVSPFGSAPVPEKTQLELDVVPAIKSLAELAKVENACTR